MQIVYLKSEDIETDIALDLYLSRTLGDDGQGLPRTIRLVVPTTQPPENFLNYDHEVEVETLCSWETEEPLPHRVKVVLTVIEANRDGESLCLLCQTDAHDPVLIQAWDDVDELYERTL